MYGAEFGVVLTGESITKIENTLEPATGKALVGSGSAPGLPPPIMALGGAPGVPRAGGGGAPGAGVGVAPAGVGVGLGVGVAPDGEGVGIGVGVGAGVPLGTTRNARPPDAAVAPLNPIGATSPATFVPLTRGWNVAVVMSDGVNVLGGDNKNAETAP